MIAAIADLDESQKTCLRLVAQGYTSKQIAQRVRLSAGTVDQYVYKANAILGVSDRKEAARIFVAAEAQAQLKRSQLKSPPIVHSENVGLMDGPGLEEPVHNSIAETSEPSLSKDWFARWSGLLIDLRDRVLATFGGEPHELNFRSKFLTICRIGFATGGTVSALVAMGYWLNYMFS